MSEPPKLYAIMRSEKSKSMADIGSRCAHNHRSTPEAAPHADPARRHLNEVLIGPGTAAETVELARARLATLPKPPRKNGNLAVEFVLSASPEFFRTNDHAKLDGWRDSAVAWLRSTWGEENVISAVLHLDEGSPHIQALVVPIHNGKLTSAHWMDGPVKMAKLQDTYWLAVERFGLHRGEKSEKPVEHQPVREFYKAAKRAAAGKRGPRVKLPERGPLGLVASEDWTKLERDLTLQNQRLADLEALRAGQLDRKKLDQAQKKLDQLAHQIDIAMVKLDELTTKIEMGKGNVARQRNEFNAREARIPQLDAAIAERSAHLAQLDARIQAAERHLEPEQPDPVAIRERLRGG